MGFNKSIINKEQEIVLYKYEGKDISVADNQELFALKKDSDKIRICYLDFETTGLNIDEDEVIEIAMKLVEYDKNNGNLLSAVAEYESYQDPGFEIDEKITQLTGITTDMVKGFSIDWKKVEELLALSQIVVAHNAKFDRKVMEKYLESKNIWACSQVDIDWQARGYMKNSLELLSVWHGFYYGAHRAMNDVNAVIHLISHKVYESTNLPVLELIKNARKKHHLIINNFSYNQDFINILKKRGGYFYHAEDKSWRMLVRDEALLDEEVLWLTEKIYNGEFRGKVIPVSIFEKYR